MSTISGITLSPNNIIGPTNTSATLTVNLSSESTEPTITIDPSYIANLDGNMTSSDGGLSWNGTINRTPGMNLLGNTLTVTSGDLSSNIVFNVVEDESLLSGPPLTIDLSATVVGNEWSNMLPSITIGQTKNLGSLSNPTSSHIFVMKKIKFPANLTSEGCLLENGGVGIGMFIGISQNKFIFGAGNGGYTDFTSLTWNNDAVLVQVDTLPSDTNEHEVVGYYNGTTNTISFYIDGIKKGNDGTVASISGGNEGGFLGLNSGGSCVSYGSTNDWPSLNNNYEELYDYQPDSILDVNTVDGFLGKDSITNEQLKNSLFIKSGSGTIVDVSGSGLTRTIITQNTNNLILDLSYNINGDNVYRELREPNKIISHSVTSVTLVSNSIEYPNTSLQFQVNFSTQQTSLSDICGNLQLFSNGNVSQIDTSSLALTNYGFRLEGNIVANPFSESDTNKITYYDETVDISGESANFVVNTVHVFELLGCTLIPSNLVDTDASATLRIEFNTPLPDYTNLNNYIDLDPSYIATLGPMSDVSSGFVWEGTLTRTPNMNKLENKLDFDFSYNGVEVSANFVFDVVENSELINQKWSLSNSDIVNKGFTNTLQMSPNGLLMGFVDGSNVEIYRKADTSYTWNHDVSYNGHSFALTNNNIAIASDVSLQIYDYSGTSWSIMNGGNILYSNVVFLSINLDGTYVAVSNNTDVKVYKFIDPNWIHYSLFSNENVKGLSLSPNGLKLGMGIGNDEENFSSIVVEDVVDNIPPEITLIGDAIINLNVGDTYTEQGATVVDNSLESLSVVISGDTVDVNVEGTYNIIYSTTDSQGNTGQTSRVVNVRLPSLVWDISSVSIFTLLDYTGHFDPHYTNTVDPLAPTRASTRHTETITGMTPSELNGDYTLECDWYSGSYPYTHGFNTSGTSYVALFKGGSFNHHIYGDNLTLKNNPYNTSGVYVGSEITGTNINIYSSQLASNGITYNGSFLQFEFPLYLVLQKVFLECIVKNGNQTYNQTYNVRDVVLLASNDKSTWDLILNDSNESDSKTLIISPNPPMYKYFKMIFTGHGKGDPHMEKLHFYGEFWK